MSGFCTSSGIPKVKGYGGTYSVGSDRKSYCQYPDHRLVHWNLNFTFLKGAHKLKVTKIYVGIEVKYTK